ncbi:hypothetical protein ISS30_03580 [bacterium]|nr:hypothetical protein [FCB group bacterium]MBL7190753.1 hypothetical protein [bacterium]
MEKQWSEDDIIFIKENIDTMSVKQLAEKLTVAPEDVESKIAEISGGPGGAEISDTAKEKLQEKKDTPEHKEYLKKGMERLAGSATSVDTYIMIKTEEGYKPLKMARKKITY